MTALSIGCDNGNGTTPGDLQPYRQAWTTVADIPFVNADITTLNVGGIEDSANFVNRGDIEIYYTLPDDRIVVQMRKFTFADSDAGAQEDFDRTIPWLYTGSLESPGEIEADDPTRNCVYTDPMTGELLAAWPDQCSIRIYFEGQSQKLRVGADMRVFLPAAWEGTLNVATTDNVEEIEDYPDRGNVTVLGLRGTSSIEVDSGDVNVRLADSTEPVPVCSAQQNADCDAVGWDTNDPSCAACQVFGRVAVTTRGEQPTSITVDAPSDLWINGTLDNTQPGLSPSTEPNCDANIDCDAFGGCVFLEEDVNKPWRRRVELNQPSASLAGLGFNINIASGACAPVKYADGPDDYLMPKEKDGGQTTLCSGCLADMQAPTP